MKRALKEAEDFVGWAEGDRRAMSNHAEPERPQEYGLGRELGVPWRIEAREARIWKGVG
jgi:hypothetical protein